MGVVGELTLWNLQWTPGPARPNAAARRGWVDASCGQRVRPWAGTSGLSEHVSGLDLLSGQRKQSRQGRRARHAVRV